MSMGAGIGGFVQGLAQGINTREGFEDRRERRLERQERREERARTRANEASISAIGRRATDEIAAGGDRREIEERYWREIQDEYARQGKPESARQFQQWRQSDETQRGIRLFQNSLMLFDQARRADGSYDPRMMQLGLRELQRAQAIPSYGGDRNIRLRPIIEGEGEAERFVGVRFEYRGDDGQTASRDIAAGEIPRAAATFFNPQAAFEDRQKQDQERRQQQERQRSEQRTDWQAAEGQVRKEYEERRDPAQQAQDRAAGRTPVTRPWDDLTADERDTLIRNRQTARTPPAQRQALGLGGGEGPSADLTLTPKTAVIMDMVYKPLRTEFLSRAEAAGRRTVDGLEMLLRQAVPSFEAFYGIAPPAEVDVRSIALKLLGEA